MCLLWHQIGCEIIYHSRLNELIRWLPRSQSVISNAHKVNWPDTRKFIYHSALIAWKLVPLRFSVYALNLLWTIGATSAVLLFCILFVGSSMAPNDYDDAVRCDLSAAKRLYSGNEIMTFLWSLNWKIKCKFMFRFDTFCCRGPSHSSDFKYSMHENTLEANLLSIVNLTKFMILHWMKMLPMKWLNARC